MFEDYPAYVGYAGMGILALLPIYFGSFESLPHPLKKANESEVLSAEDAYWFPVLGSLVLFGFYLVFHFLSKELVDMLILFYFSMVGTATVYHLFAPILRSIVHQVFHYEAREFESEVPPTEEEKEKETSSIKGGAGGKGIKKVVKRKKKVTPKSLSFVESLLEPLEYKFLYNHKGKVSAIHMIFKLIFS